VNTGTIPSKTLRESAMHLAGFKQRELFGVDIAVKSDIPVADFMYRARHVTARQWQLIERNLVRHRIDRFNGVARFLDPHRIAIASEAGEQIVRGEIVLIATGSSPHHPPGVDFDHRTVYDSDSILQLDRIPKSLAVVGAGVIGCEYASIFAALGVEVHLIDGRTTLLGHIDTEIVDVLLRSFQERLNIRLHLGSDVASLAHDDVRATLHLQDGSTIIVDKILYAAGRSSNTEGLGLEAAGVRSGKRGLVEVNEHYQTNVPNIFAAGDVIGFPALASTSMEQARVAMVHAFDLKYKTSIARILPYAIYTIPELATVGESEQSCAEKKIDYEIGRAFFEKNPRGQIIGDSDGMIKLLFDPQSLKLLGVHIVGENASELLHVGVMVMHFGGTINAFIENVFNYPTLGDGYKYAAYDGLGNVAKTRAAVPAAQKSSNPKRTTLG
jgi:NAD(P) transhydrogenase